MISSRPDLKPRRKAVGYCRVSTLMQAEEGYSIDVQQKNILDYCHHKNLHFLTFYTDEAMSGKNMLRPALQDMLSSLDPGTSVICSSISRISRSVKDFQHIYELITSKGCDIILLDMDVDTTTPTGRVFLTVMSAIAQFEREQTGVRISSVINSLSKDGKLITKPPYGFKLIKDGHNSVLVEDESEQFIINRIREILSDDPRETFANISKILNREGLKLRKCKTIYPTVVKKIIAQNNLRT